MLFFFFFPFFFDSVPVQKPVISFLHAKLDTRKHAKLNLELNHALYFTGIPSCTSAIATSNVDDLFCASAKNLASTVV